MGFVQAGFLAALTAIAVTIIIHLIFGRRARRVDLGTLRFLQIVLRENVRRRRIKRWLLLALWMTCFALLADAIAQFLGARKVALKCNILFAVNAIIDDASVGQLEA